jgi:7,8-dihydropterin-6-yl-methyl-4-(beta-D-ribofuranosyl)aminobenzene 5'-phosphate synthase
MNLIIVYDNNIYTNGIGLQSDWGFACLITTPQETILFDTGAKGDILLHNLEILHLNPSEIKKIVISHEHSDHNGGLKVLSRFIPDVDLYRLLPNTSKTILQYPDRNTMQKINETIWITGRLKGPIDEQALILKGKTGWYVLTGCSHPGVKTILQAAQCKGDVRGIIGGFHDFHTLSVLNGLDLICPCHCTKYKQKIRKQYTDTCIPCGVGQRIKI